MVWDVDGKVRLNYSTTDGGRPKIDLTETQDIWDQYWVKVGDHYGFDAEQLTDAEEVFAAWDRQLVWYFEEHETEIVEYFHGLDRRDANRKDTARQEVESLRGQSDEIESKLVAARAPWLAQVADLWAGYEEALLALATPEQLEKGPVPLPKPEVAMMDTNTIDRIVPYFDFLVGVLLILGLFTRIAALAGAGFLFSIILTQWPGSIGAQPSYYLTIEMLGMLVLAAMAAGQYAGLDYVLCGIWSNIRRTNQGTNS